MKFLHGCVLLSLSLTAAHADSGFTTGGNGIRKIVPGTIKGQRVLFTSELDGSVACHLANGKELWRNPTQSPAVMFDIEAVDVDNDGRDDLITASGDGSITCWNANGSRRWTFTPEPKVRFSEVASIKKGSRVEIFAGGNNRKLYKLDGDGRLILAADIPGVVRKIERGLFHKKGEETLFLMTLTHDKTGWNTFGFVDPDSLKIEKNFNERGPANIKGKMLTDLDVSDLDGDGRDDLLLFYMDKAKCPTYVAMNGDFEELAMFDVKGNKTRTRNYAQRYAHAIGQSLVPVRDEVLVQFGRCWLVMDREGNVLKELINKNARFTVSDFALDAENKILYGAGEVSGGDDVYAYDLTKDDWWTQNDEMIGRTAEVNENLRTLYKQVLDYTMPDYQAPSDKPWLIVCPKEPSEAVQAMKGNQLVLAEMKSWTENYDRSHIVAAIGDIALKEEGRKVYELKREDFVNKAEGYEAANQPFVIWAGHGNDPFYMHIETMEAILEAAPKTCYGFVYAEMANPHDPRSHYFVDHIMPQLAKALRKNGKAKLYFRYKHTFWATDVQVEPWKRLFLSKKYRDILVPCTEDTNSYTQELNLAGRVGMLMGGYVDDFGIRLIDDNVTGWRPLAPAMQKSFSPWLRSALIRSAHGARIGLFYSFSNTEEPGVELLYALMASGVLPIAERDQIESIGSWHLVDGIHEDLLHGESHEGHNIDIYNPKDLESVFACKDPHWAGASVPEYDISKQLGVHYRWLHFVPELPNGMIPIAPAEMAEELEKNGVPFVVSNAKNGIAGGKEIPANQFGPTLKKAAELGASKLPIRISGASWGGVRLDEHHIRLILIDPHYLDPRDCETTIEFQSIKPTSVVDILSKETIGINGDKTTVSVPAGSARFLDVTY